MNIEDPVKIEPDIIIAGMPCFIRPALARSLGKSEQTLAGWSTRKFGPPYFMIGRRVLYPRREVLKWLESRLVNPAKT